AGGRTRLLRLLVVHRLLGALNARSVPRQASWRTPVTERPRSFPRARGGVAATPAGWSWLALRDGPTARRPGACARHDPAPRDKRLSREFHHYEQRIAIALNIRSFRLSWQSTY